ncbi:hypothetical protein ABZ876_01300 [Streptomyces sp. NPDC046931]|uniref:hypothetical protein n=1 Tax=Streptomyces sp. NPDC046931 TaxID=3154806 RepID=UPI0033D5A465
MSGLEELHRPGTAAPASGQDPARADAQDPDPAVAQDPARADGLPAGRGAVEPALHEGAEPAPGPPARGGAADPVPVRHGAVQSMSPGGAAPSPRPHARGGPADPVKALMHRHRDLCERAVDPLEIAAGLEAHGLTDRAAARFRHRDVFALAEEMYARVPRDGDRPPPSPASADALRESRAWAALVLLPGALCTGAVIVLRLTDGRLRLAAAALGALAVALGIRAALGRGPLRAPTHRSPAATRVWTCWLLAHALLGDGLLRAALDGGPDGPWPPATAPVLALTLACAPAAWCARLFAAGARRRLAASRGLTEFTASVTPLLLAAVALFGCALAALLTLCAAVLHQGAGYAGAGALGTLLLLARLLTAYGHSRAPAVVLGTATAVEATALATAFAGRLPGCGFLATPVRALADAFGTNAVPALVCAPAALALLVHATRTLTRASAHARPPGSP